MKAVARLLCLTAAARLDLHEEGGHGVGNLIPTRVKHNFTGAQWPKVLVEWLGTQDPKK
jgi:hypothetical protein